MDFEVICLSSFVVLTNSLSPSALLKVSNWGLHFPFTVPIKLPLSSYLFLECAMMLLSCNEKSTKVISSLDSEADFSSKDTSSG